MNKIRAVLMAVSILSGSAVSMAVDRCYIEDFSIEAGETKELSIILENDFDCCAFQISITLPEGLSFVDYRTTAEINKGKEAYYVKLSERKVDHTIAAKLSGNVLEMLASSLNNYTFYSGEGVGVTDGAIAYVKVLASEDFVGTAEIALGIMKFGSPDESKHTLEPTTTIVSEPSAEPDGIPLTLQMANSKGEVNMYVTEGSVQAFKFVADEGYVLHSVTFNGTDVTESVNSYNVYRTPAITEASTLNVTFEVATGVEEVVSSDRVKVTASNGVIRVNGTVSGENVGLYTSTGVQVNFVVSNGDKIEFTATPGTVYIVKNSKSHRKSSDVNLLTLK